MYSIFVKAILNKGAASACLSTKCSGNPVPTTQCLGEPVPTTQCIGNPVPKATKCLVNQSLSKGPPLSLVLY